MITVSTNYSVMLLYTLVTYPYIFCSHVSNVDPIGRFFLYMLLPKLCYIFTNKIERAYCTFLELLSESNRVKRMIHYP